MTVFSDDDLEFEQDEDMRSIGIAKMLLQRQQLYAGVVSRGMLSFVFYQSMPEWIQSAIPIWAFFSVLALGIIIVVLVNYKIVLPGEIAFSERQSYKRNPLAEDVEDLHDDVRALRDEIDDD